MPTYGWYSAQSAAKGYGTFIYERADGTEVEVTQVSSDPAGSHYNWPDKVCVGEVTTFRRQGQPRTDGQMAFKRCFM